MSKGEVREENLGLCLVKAGDKGDYIRLGYLTKYTIVTNMHHSVPSRDLFGKTFYILNGKKNLSYSKAWVYDDSSILYLPVEIVSINKISTTPTATQDLPSGYYLGDEIDV